MLSSDLKQGCTYRFEVDKDQSNNKFYKVRTDDNVEFSLLKFKFQQKLPIPDYIQCYVKSLYPLTISQDIACHIPNFYKENEEYIFNIKGFKNDPENQYEIEDENGLCFKLLNVPIFLPKGSRVKCKVIKIRDANVTLKYVGNLSLKFPLDFHDLSFYLNVLNINVPAIHYLKLFKNIPEFEDVIVKYESGDPSWVIDLLQQCKEHIPDWFIECKDDITSLRRICRRINILTELALYILEESDFLRECEPEQRSRLQMKLSTYVEIFEQYNQAASKIINKTHERFIDRMFSRLKIAGYLYKPSRQIRIMMTILKLRPELINSRMGELFEALHNWDIINWESEPFRGALVQQLQIFIEENYKKINLLPANDKSMDNKSISRMISAIAIQRLLATETDKIDLNLNRAMLYRYISYLMPGSVEILLTKGIEALLGIEYPNEYTWKDTGNPTLLFFKCSHPHKPIEDRDIIIKSYSTSKVDIFLKSNDLQIIAKGADPDSTVIPNNMFDWLNPRISLVDSINVPNRKNKDLRSFRNIWDEISWSIFGEEQSSGEKIEKRFPENGEEVKIIIDGVRIQENVNDKQKLQFHCTICDEIYIGEGWMPCDAIHMLGWLSHKDVPLNYDMSLKFSQNKEGEPLIYYANAFKKPSGEYEFKMKNQIEDYMLENSYLGQESIAIVTYLDRNNNAWLCLSETGATFKVACDDSTSELSEGKLVRVRYLEPDRSNTLTQFFIGELSHNQEDIPSIIKKSECLANLMQGLGFEAPHDEDFQVHEVEEVMSKEELLEMIYILQRRAYSEEEYLKAYNYLGLASILCKIAEAPEVLNEVKIHMDLLEFLQDFGKNQTLDIDILQSYEEKVSRTPMLERIFTRLKIVSDLGLNENSNWLWEVRTNPRNETEGSLASLVLSYNMLPKELENSKNEIIKQISTLLNVNSTTSTSIYYGDESQTVEFKSSMVYSTHGGSKPVPKEQMFEITHTICGFMNARGGTLYIGVNDAGYENGLDDDLNYRKSHGEKPSIDAMIVDLQNHLDRVLPSHSKDHWEISSDPESKKGVIVVKVLPVEQPVELEGVIYVRASSTTKPRLDEERDEFIKNRSHNYKLQMTMWGMENVSESLN